MARQSLSLTLDEKDYLLVQRAVSQLSKVEQTAVVQKALQEGVRLFVQQGKVNLRNTLSHEPQNVRMRKGNLMKAFSTRVKKRLAKGYAGFNKYGHHAHLVDSGTVKRWTKNGAYRGSVSKNAPQTGSRFWRMAFEQKKMQAAKEVMESVQLSIQKIISRN